MAEAFRVILLVALAAAALTTGALLLVWWMEPVRRMRRALLKSLGAPPEAETVEGLAVVTELASAALQKVTCRDELHPSDAEPRGIADGDPVRVFNALGDVHCIAQVTPNSIGCPVVAATRRRSARSSTNASPSVV